MKKEKKKSVAIIYHYFAHYRLPILKELSKSEQVDYTFYSAKSSGTDIKTIDPNLANIEVENGGLRFHFFKNIWIYKQLFLWQKGLLKLSLKSNYDAYILLGNFFYISSWVAAIILRIRKKKVYFWSHGVTSDAKGIKWTLRKTFYNLANGMMLYGNNAKDVMIKNGFSPNKLDVIYNSLDYDKQLKYRQESLSINVDKVKRELFKNPELPLMFFVGRLTLQKKLEMIVEVSKQLHENNFKINTLFIGNGVAKENLVNLVSEYNLQEYFNFYGACYDESELCKLIYSSNICVSPGEVGLTVMTSLGYGTPVITHGDFNYQMPEYEAIVPGVSGDFFERGSISSLSDTIKSWLDSNKDKPNEEIRKNCYKVIDDKYNPKKQTSIINGIILRNE